MGEAYLRYSFTKGTVQEVDALVELLDLRAGERVLDVGCGPGRHAHELARRGVQVVGVDISERFVEVARAGAPAGATFERLDARHLPYDAEFDAAISLCQGGFGLAGQVGVPAPLVDPDGQILTGMARALRPGGRLAVSAFSAYFQVRHLEDTDSFDADNGVNLERTEVWDDQRQPLEADLLTSCFTPRELRLLAAASGLDVLGVWSVTPGRYGARRPVVDEPEFLLVAQRPAPPAASAPERASC
ncbi:MAG: class I SAM-dependent methyltransferase [Acidimicrobiales bacterium]|nr:class I SAM-dependent methyltransferase [Acidimicrobiales bacterium]